jgi:hypothetical protein
MGIGIGRDFVRKDFMGTMRRSIRKLPEVAVSIAVSCSVKYGMDTLSAHDYDIVADQLPLVVGLATYSLMGWAQRAVSYRSAIKDIRAILCGGARLQSLLSARPKDFDYPELYENLRDFEVIGKSMLQGLWSLDDPSLAGVILGIPGIKKEMEVQSMFMYRYLPWMELEQERISALSAIVKEQESEDLARRLFEN